MRAQGMYMRVQDMGVRAQRVKGCKTQDIGARHGHKGAKGERT